MRIVAAAAYLFGLRPAVAVSELGIHRGLMKLESSLHAGPMTTQDGKTGKPTVDSGEHLDPYDVPAELIGDVGMAGAKGAQGAQGECGDPGPRGENLTLAANTSKDRIWAMEEEGKEPPLESMVGVTRAMLLQLVLFNIVCLGFIYVSLKKRITLVEQVKAAIDQVVDESYLSMSFTIVNVSYPDVEASGSAQDFENLVLDVLARAAVAGGAAGITAENAAVAMGEGEGDSTLVSATMSAPEGSTSAKLQQAMQSGQLQSLLPPAVDAARGAETYKKGAVLVMDLDIQIEGGTDGQEASAPAAQPMEVSGDIQEL